MAASILWYDLETFGRDPEHDRIAQCAMVRTDESLEEIGEPLVLYCRLPSDYLPDPEACFIHGITPQEVEERGLCEYEFALRLLEEMSVPQTTVAGYNTIQFDDEFIRRLFFRNLLDPYAREYRNDNSRWDIINLMRVVHDLKHEKFGWPANGEGNPSFKLEDLARANGIPHDSAHDALSDVRATVGLARKVRQEYPRLYDWYYRHRHREALARLVNLSDRNTMLVHTSRIYTRPVGCSTVVTPLGLVEEDRHALVVYDLRYDPRPLERYSEEDLRGMLFTERKSLSDTAAPAPALASAAVQIRPAVAMVRLNSCPFLAPVSVLDRRAQARLQIDMETCERNLQYLNEMPALRERLIALYHYEKAEEQEPGDPEYALYSGGFIPDQDRRLLEHFHERLRAAGPLAAKNEFFRIRFQDRRIGILLHRLIARNYPETLSLQQQKSWLVHTSARIQLPLRRGATAVADYAKLQEELETMGADDPRRRIARALLEWKERIEQMVKHGIDT